ncbi:MAG: hypothetical protein Q4P28_02850 [Tissierellia bacterium]|nr:hypothetical protein [Tissierellia bacterium]
MKIINKKILGIVLIIAALGILFRIYQVNQKTPEEIVFHEQEEIQYGKFKGKVLKSWFLSKEEKESVFEEITKEVDRDYAFPEGWTTKDKMMGIEVEMNQERVPGFIYKKGLHDRILSIQGLGLEPYSQDIYHVYYPIDSFKDSLGEESYVLNLAGGDNEKQTGKKAYVQLEPRNEK